MGLLLGYVRVSTTDQHGQAQFDALIEAGVPEEHIYFDQLSGAKAAKERPGLTALPAYARRDDTVLVYRIDRPGRSLIDVLNTVALMQERGIGLKSIVDGIDPSSAAGRMQLALFATLAEHERELINERVRAGVLAAKARGVKFGQKPVKQETAEAKLEVARQLLSQGTTATRAAETVGWSRATLLPVPEGARRRAAGRAGPAGGPGSGTVPVCAQQAASAPLLATECFRLFPGWRPTDSVG